METIEIDNNIISDKDLGFKPAGVYLAIKQRVVTMTKGGVHLPDTVTKGGSLELWEGEVIGVGPLVDAYNVGDWVWFSKYAVSFLKRNNVEYIMLKDSDVFATLDKERMENDNKF
jgi:co-chaperonin GroES (HSP10)